MTREEAIKIFNGIDELEAISMFYEPGGKAGSLTIRGIKEASRIAISALRAQQTSTNLDRSRWEGCHYCDGDETVMGLDWIYGLDHILTDYKYCPMCGRPLTGEAWAELERRINGGQN